MLDLNNCVAASVDHSYHDMWNWIETSENAERKHFPNLFPPGNEKRCCVRTIVDAVWPLAASSHRKRAKNEASLMFRWVNLSWSCNPIENQYLVNGQLPKHSLSRWTLSLSPRYGHVVLVNGYLVLTGANWSKHGCPMSKMYAVN